MAFLAWLSRIFIRLAAGIGVGCVTFGILALTGDPKVYDIDRMNRMGPPFGPACLALGIGLITIAFLLWLLSRKSLPPKRGLE
jgi:hypothetical protein